MIEQFHLLRPLWLLALLPLVFITLLFFKRGVLSRSWKSVIDPLLLPHLLSHANIQQQSKINVMVFFIAALAVIFSLAGPTWQKRPQPVFKQDSALVIALDLSRSMDANDIKPSRLSRARHKISDLLKLRKEGQTALIVYAADAYTVTPLTDDTETISALLPSLSSDIMPSQGSRTDIALSKAAELLSNAGIAHGDVLLVTDGAGQEAESAIKNIVDKGHRVSILAIGMAEGAPIALSDGGFLKDSNGSIVIAKVDFQHLKKLSLFGHGSFKTMSTDDSDIQSLQNLMSVDRLKSKNKNSKLKTDLWQEQGYWLLLIIIPLAVFIFRQGYLALLFFIILPLPQPAHAISWDELWLNDNQRAAQALEKNEAKAAAELFNDPAWKASAQFKNKQFDEAAKNFSSLRTADGFYNQGNALAKAGKYDAAIKAYQQALDLQADHEDAKYNKEHIEKQQEESKSKNNSDKTQDDKQDSEKNNDSNQADQKQSNKNDSTENNQDKSQGKNQQDDQTSEKQDTNKPADSKDTKESNTNENTESKNKPAEENQQQQPQASKDKQDSDNNDESPSLSQQAAKQWLRRIPDDPGGLLRNKFKYQYKQQQNHADEIQNW